MSSVEASSENAAGSPPVMAGEMRLEVVVVPVSDVDRAKRFYEGLGWRLDADLAVDEELPRRAVDAAGLGCSIIFGNGVTLGGARLGAGPAALGRTTSTRRAPT